MIAGCVSQGAPETKFIEGLSVVGVQQIDRLDNSSTSFSRFRPDFVYVFRVGLELLCVMRYSGMIQIPSLPTWQQCFNIQVL